MLIIHDWCLCLPFLLFTESIGVASLYGFLFFIGMLVFAIFAGTMESKKKTQQQNFLLALKPDSDHFHDSLSYIADDLRTKITIDNKNDQFFIWLPEDPNVKTINDVKSGMAYKVYTYSHTDILAIQHIEDAVCLTKRARKSSSAKFWLTETPAFTDVSTTQPTKKSGVNTISLVILVRDKAHPIHRIHFYTNPSKSLQKIQMNIHKFKLTYNNG